MFPSRIKAVVLSLIIMSAWVFTAATQEAAEGRVLPDSLNAADTLQTDTLAVTDTLLSEALTDSVYIDSLFYSCDSIRYEVNNERMTLAGNSAIRYGTASINADSIHIDMKADQASSNGKVEMRDGNYIMLGDAVYYDVESKQALVDRGATRFEKGYFYGREIRKVGAKTYDVDNGYFTTCDAAEPDYYIWSRRMRLYKDDKIVAKPTVFFVNHFPVFGFPYGTFTIKRGRKSGILVPEPGYNSTDGKYIKNIAYFLAMKDYADATFAFDFMEKTGWEASIEGRYTKRYRMNGTLYARLQKRLLSMGQTQYEWLLRETHHQEIGYASSLDANLDFVSSRSIWEGSENTDERLSEKVTSRLAWETPLFSRSVYVNATYSDDLLNDVKTLTLPSLSYTLPSKPIYELFVNEDEQDVDTDAWWSDFSYSFSLRGVHTGTVQDPDATLEDILWKSSRDSTGAFVNQHNAGLRNTMGLSWSHKLRGWLSLTESLSGNVATYDRDQNNNKLATGYDWSNTARASFSLYGVRKFPAGLLTAVRHVVTPSLSFTYKPDMNRNDRFYSFGGIGLNSSDRSRSLAMALDNLWQLKVRKTDEEELKLNDFFKTNSSISFNMEKEGIHRFSDISHTAQFNPGTYTLPLVGFNLTDRLTLTQSKQNFDITYWRLATTLHLTGTAAYTDYFPKAPNSFQSSRFLDGDTLDVETEAVTIDQLEQPPTTDGWSWDITHEYAKRMYSDTPTHTLRNTVSVKLTQNWQLSYTNNYDLADHRMVSQNITVTRDLHCWKLNFSWSRSGDYWNYTLKLFAVKLPDSLLFRTSDHKH